MNYYCYVFLVASPDFVNGFNTTIYNTSDTLTLYCIYNSFPVSQITWYRKTVSSNDSDVILEDNRTDIVHEGIKGVSESGSGLGIDLMDLVYKLFQDFQGSSVLPLAVSVLDISDLRYEDEGNYTCSADNGVTNLIHSVTHNTAFVTVQSKTDRK